MFAAPHESLFRSEEEQRREKTSKGRGAEPATLPRHGGEVLHARVLA